MMNRFKQYFLDLDVRAGNAKEIFIYFTIVGILIIASFLGAGKLLIAYQDAMDVRQEVDSMQIFLQDYNSKVTSLNRESYRAIKTDQLDNVQSNLLLALQANRLDLISFKNINDKSSAGNLYEIEFVGNWESTVRILDDFHVRDALISIYHVHIEPNREGGVKTIVQYKIYTK